MWLLDANMDVHLVSELSGFHISCETAVQRARDQLVGESASSALKQFPTLAVVVVNVPQRPWPEYREEFLARWSECRIEPIGGKLIHWP